MAIIAPSALIESVKGIWNGSQFQSWKGINVVRSVSLPSLIHSSQRQRIRCIISTLSGLYYLLTPDQKDAWDTFAEFYAGARSGFNSFVRLNASLKLSGIPELSQINDAPESYEAPDTPIISKVKYDGDTKEIVINWSIPYSSIVYVFSYLAVQVYYSNVNSANYKLVNCVQSDTKESRIDISAYPDDYCFMIRCRSMKQNGIVSANSTEYKICKTVLPEFDNLLFFSDVELSYLNNFTKDTLSFIQRTNAWNGPPLTYTGGNGITSDFNNLYITNSGNDIIIIANKSDLSYVNSFGSTGSGDMQFNLPEGIACDDLYLYITDRNNDRIKIHDKFTYALIDIISSLNGGAITFNYPCGITVDDNYIYFTDYNNHRIFKVNKTDYSDYLMAGSLGSGDENFNDPIDIAVNSTHIFITDKRNNRIIKRNISTLAFHSKFGTAGSGDSNFNWPYGIALDNIYLYITDSENYRLKVHKISDLAYVTELKNVGLGPGQFYVALALCHIYRG